MRESFFRILQVVGFLSPFMLPDLAYSQETQEQSGAVSTVDTAYVQDFKNLLTARLYLLNQNASLVFTETGGERIVYKPNVNVRVGIAAFYKWFGLGISIKNPFFERNPDKYGKTTSIDWRINAYGRQIAGELFYQNYKGFYIHTPVANDGSLFKLPEMKMSSFGITAYWIFNYRRFSIRAAFIQNEQQKKSAGSLIISPFFNYYKITSSGGIVPRELMETYNIRQDDVLESGQFYAVGLAPGYSYSFVFLKNCYINGALFPGVYWQSSSYTTLVESESSGDFSFFLNARIAAGYNSTKWFIGASVITALNDIPTIYAGSKFYYGLAQMRFWAGTRFDWFHKKTKKM